MSGIFRKIQSIPECVGFYLEKAKFQELLYLEILEILVVFLIKLSQIPQNSPEILFEDIPDNDPVYPPPWMVDKPLTLAAGKCLALGEGVTFCYSQ